MIKAILIDFGGVLFNVDILGYIYRVGIHISKDPNNVKKILTGQEGLKLRFDYECGLLSGDCFLESLEKQLTAKIDPKTYWEKIHPCITGINILTREVLWLLRKKQQEQIRIIGITNIDIPHLKIANQLLHQHKIQIDEIVASCCVGSRKPKPTIYHLARRAAGCRTNQCLFVDDRKINIQTAIKLGMQTHHFENAYGLFQKLRKHNLI